MKEKTSSILGRYSGKSADASVLNANEMHLGRRLFENILASEDYKRAMKLRQYIGFLGHPAEPDCQDFKNACIVMTEMHLEGDDVYASFDLIDTPVGRIVKAFQDAGVTFGISIRGAGDVAADGEVDPDTFCFRGYDLVAFQAYSDAVPKYTAIAASSDPVKSKQYKKIYASIQQELPNITSQEALTEIQNHLSDKSEAFQDIESRKAQLAEDASIVPQTAEQEEDIRDAQLQGMTELYLAERQLNQELTAELLQVKSALANLQATQDHTVAAATRILKDQISILSSKLTASENSRKTLVAASVQLKKANSDLSDSNLHIKMKLEQSSKQLENANRVLASTREDLSKTVAEADGLRKRASDLDGQVKSLRRSVTATTRSLREYQDAYSRLYASAMGAQPPSGITASTNVAELKQMISASRHIDQPRQAALPELEDLSFGSDDLVII